MSPNEYIDRLLLEDPLTYGRSRIQAATHLLEGTELPKGKVRPYPLPEDLWPWVLKNPPVKLGGFLPPAPPNTNFDQEYLGVHSAHWRPVWRWDLTANSLLWKVADKKEWQPLIRTVLQFWATHTTRPPGIEAALLGQHFSPIQIWKEIEKNQKVLARIEAGKPVFIEETLRALGWDSDAHQGHEKEAAAAAQVVHKELAGLDKVHREHKQQRDAVYHALLASKIDLRRLHLNPIMLKKTQQARRVTRLITKMTKKLR